MNTKLYQLINHFYFQLIRLNLLQTYIYHIFCLPWKLCYFIGFLLCDHQQSAIHVYNILAAKFGSALKNAAHWILQGEKWRKWLKLDGFYQRQRKILDLIRDVQNYLQTTWVANIITTELNFYYSEQPWLKNFTEGNFEDLSLKLCLLKFMFVTFFRMILFKWIYILMVSHI